MLAASLNGQLKRKHIVPFCVDVLQRLPDPGSAAVTVAAAITGKSPIGRTDKRRVYVTFADLNEASVLAQYELLQAETMSVEQT
jgi:hypothetical protein